MAESSSYATDSMLSVIVAGRRLRPGTHSDNSHARSPTKKKSGRIIWPLIHAARFSVVASPNNSVHLEKERAASSNAALRKIGSIPEPLTFNKPNGGARVCQT